MQNTIFCAHLKGFWSRKMIIINIAIGGIKKAPYNRCCKELIGKFYFAITNN